MFCCCVVEDENEGAVTVAVDGTDERATEKAWVLQEDGRGSTEGAHNGNGSKTGVGDVFTQIAEAEPPKELETREEAVRRGRRRFEQDDEGEILELAPPPPDSARNLADPSAQLQLHSGLSQFQPDPESGYEEAGCEEEEVDEDDEELPPINPVEAWEASPLGAGWKQNTMGEEEDPEESPEPRRGKVDLSKLSIFSVVLTKPGKIGLSVRHHNAAMLEIVSIKDGLIHDYNEQIRSGVIQGTEVQPGDVVDRVNGNRGSASSLLKTIAESGQTQGEVRLELCFIRGLPSRQPPPRNTPGD